MAIRSARLVGRCSKAILALAIGFWFCHPALAAPTYWNVFNVEGESTIAIDIVTYASLTDMLLDTNRTGVSTMPGFPGRNVVGSGAFVAASVPVPEPSTFALLGAGLFGLILRRRR